MNQRLTTSLSVLLIGVFMIFIVGLPVVTYLCPMMNTSDNACGMMPAKGSGSAFTNVIPACCSKYIVAEGNTTPFLKIQDDLSHLMAVEPISSFAQPNANLSGSTVLMFHDEAESPPTALFILHSSLLI